MEDCTFVPKPKGHDTESDNAVSRFHSLEATPAPTMTARVYHKVPLQVNYNIHQAIPRYLGILDADAPELVVAFPDITLICLSTKCS